MNIQAEPPKSWVIWDNSNMFIQHQQVSQQIQQKDHHHNHNNNNNNKSLRCIFCPIQGTPKLRSSLRQDLSCRYFPQQNSDEDTILTSASVIMSVICPKCEYQKVT